MSDATPNRNVMNAPLHGQGVYERLLEEVRSGVLSPGTRLTETELAERLQVSRTPVREAIRQLEADGLVVHRPRAGATVRQLDYPEVVELYEMRTVLEGTAARLAARSASDVEIAELGSINEEMEASVDDGAVMFSLNRQFHASLIAAARNRFLLKSVNAVHTALLILGPSTLKEADRANAAISEHAAVIAAIRERNDAKAEAQMRAHMEAAQRIRLRQLRRQGRLGTYAEQEEM